MPSILMFFVAKAFPGMTDPSTQQIYLCVCNQDTGFLSEALIEDLEDRGFIIQCLKMIEERKNSQWHRTLIIPERFTTRTLQGQRVALYLEIENGSSQSALEGVRIKIYKAVGRIIGNLCLMKKQNIPVSGEKVEAGYQQIEALKPCIELDSTFAGKGKVIAGGYNLAVPGMIVMSIIYSSLAYCSALFVQERGTGMLRRLVATPCLPWEILSGKLLGRVLMGIIQMVILLLVSHFVLEFYLGNALLGWFLCLVPFAFACGALGMLIGCFFRSVFLARVLGWVATPIMAAFGGCWWPKEVVPDYLNYIGYLFPAAWAVDGLQKIISFGQSPMSLLPQIGVLCGFFVLFMVLCVRFFRYD